jgi:general secretion pathway protein F
MTSIMTQPAYAYRAARADGALESGVVEAPTREAASALLTQRGLFPLDLTLRDEPRSNRSRVSADDQALGLRMLATLLESGLPMSRALAALGDLAPVSWTSALAAVRESVREGRTLAHALANSGLGLPTVLLGIIHAGEAGSGVAPAVRRAAEFAEASAATRRAVRGALAYPLVLASAGLATVALLVSVVVPRFAGILADLGQELPASTRLVLGAAEWSRTLALPALLVSGVLVVIWRAWIANEPGRRQWHAWMLEIPIAGRVRRSAAASRACATLAALLESGVALPSALAHAARACGDAALGARLVSAREAIAHGERMSAAIERERALTATAVRLIRAGEETGRLAGMLDHAARIESDRATHLVKSAVRLLEPALILAFGALVAVVAAALMQAVYSVRPV